MITAIIAPTPPNTAPTSLEFSVVVTDGLLVVVGVVDILIFIVLILLGAARNVSAMLGGDANVVGLMLISEMVVNHAR